MASSAGQVDRVVLYPIVNLFKTFRLPGASTCFLSVSAHCSIQSFNYILALFPALRLKGTSNAAPVLAAMRTLLRTYDYLLS